MWKWMQSDVPIEVHGNLFKNDHEYKYSFCYRMYINTLLYLRPEVYCLRREFKASELVQQEVMDWQSLYMFFYPS